jgi:flagellar motor switch/type III secretory pathway protein FliN
MTRSSELRLIDLLTLVPGTLLRLHAVKGETECLPGAVDRGEGWEQELSHAVFPQGDPQKLHNFSLLLSVPIDFQVIIRHPGSKVLELLRIDPVSWHTIIDRVGCQVDIMVDGRVIARGEIVNAPGQSGILIKELASAD